MPQQTWVPTANAASYRDLLRFEQRLLQNAETLARSRRRWQGVSALPSLVVLAMV